MSRGRLEGSATFAADQTVTWPEGDRVLRVTVGAGACSLEDVADELRRAVSELGAYDGIEITVTKK